MFEYIFISAIIFKIHGFSKKLYSIGIFQNKIDKHKKLKLFVHLY